MKKKILSFIMALCFIIPCTAMLSACNDDKSTVTEQEWNSALDYANKTNIYIHRENITEGDTFDSESIVKYDGTTIYWSQWFKQDAENSLVEYFYTKDNSKYFKIEKGAKGNQKFEISESEYRSEMANEMRNLINGLTYKDFNYNAESKSYISTNKEVEITFKFKNKTLEKIEITRTNNESGTVPFVETTTITFDKVTINIPSV